MKLNVVRKSCIDVKKKDLIQDERSPNDIDKAWRVLSIETYHKPYHPFRKFRLQRGDEETDVTYHIEDFVNTITPLKPKEKLRHDVKVVVEYHTDIARKIVKNELMFYVSLYVVVSMLVLGIAVGSAISHHN